MQKLKARAWATQPDGSHGPPAADRDVARSRMVEIGIAVVVAAVLVVAVLAGIVSENGKPKCQDVRFGQASGPVRQSPLSGISGTGARVRAAFGRARGEVAYCNDFADPFVVQDGSRYYAYSTQSGSMNIPVMRVAGLFDSGRRHDALPQLPAWSKPGAVWAPSVVAAGASYILYYTTAVAATGAQCLSHATARTPDGPFVDTSSGPWICPAGGGSIDASPFVAADGRRYLVWKYDDGFSGIAGAELSADGLQLASPISHMLTATLPWETGTIEGPDLVAAPNGYWLFYSGGDWRTAGYSIGVAHCSGPLGPCAKVGPDPLVTSTAAAAGPGGEQLFADSHGQNWVVFHAWVNGRVGYPSGARGLFVAPISLAGSTPTIG